MSRIPPKSESLQREPDPAILALVRALARQAARQDHALAMEKRNADETRRDL